MARHGSASRYSIAVRDFMIAGTGMSVDIRGIVMNATTNNAVRQRVRGADANHIAAPAKAIT